MGSVNGDSPRPQFFAGGVVAQFRIEPRGHAAQFPFQLQAELFLRRGVAVTRHEDRFAIVKDRAGEGRRQLEPIPAREFFFLRAEKATGTMGRPVMRASWIGPAVTE